MLIRRMEDLDVEPVVELVLANYDGVMARHPFYEHAGFVVDALQPDAEIEMTWMTKPLGPGSAERGQRASRLELRSFDAGDLEPVQHSVPKRP